MSGAAFDPGRAGVVAGRIVRQVAGDRRSLALVLVVPVGIILLLGYVLRGSHGTTRLGVITPTATRGVAPPTLPGLTVSLVQPSAAEIADAQDRLDQGNLDGLLDLRGLQSGSAPQLSVRGDDAGRARLLQAATGQIVATLSRPPAAASGQAAPAVQTRFLQGGPEFDTLDYAAPGLLGFFALFLVFLLTVVSFLRERTTGTLERLLISPLRRLEIVGGYMLGFGLFAIVQAVLLVLVLVLVLRIHRHGDPLLALVFVALIALSAVNLGIFCSTFATTELQAIQFIPIVIVPQALLSGLLFSVASLPAPLHVAAYLLPMTYATDALKAILIAGATLTDRAVLRDLAVLVGFAALFLVAGALTLREELA